MPLRQPGGGYTLLKTGQTTPYHVGDDGDYEVGASKRYTVNSAGAQSGTVNLDVASYAANTLAFVAGTKKITDSANGLAHIKTGDTIVIRNSANNEGAVLTVATGNVAAEVVVNEAIVDEGAGRYVKIYKRASHSNNTVRDERTKLEWSRYTSSAEKVGAASDGKLNWYDAATCFTLHAAAADLQMVAGAAPILRIVGGAGEIARYTVGDILVCSGFANAVNNLPGYRVTVVAVNGADLDISLDPVNNTTVSEAAGGSRAIKLVCRSIFGYAAAARAASLGGYADWRAPNRVETQSVMNTGASDAKPNTTAFPSWPNTIHSATQYPTNVNANQQVQYNLGQVYGVLHTSADFAALVRGGV